jgi:glycosyltransferase domain-containing protein
LRNWFLGNSTHVIDTAFFLGGKPKALHALHKGGTKWHPAASIFAGAGESESGALFSYHANWDAPGRWVIEMLTRQHRLIFKPMERLQIQNLGSVEINPVMIDESLDKDYKPGLYLQTKAFLENDHERYCTLNEQRENIENFYIPMSGYSLDQKPTYSLFTVIIPTYNRPEYLKKILSYYLSFGIKIIVVDASDEVFPYLSLYGNQIEYRHTPNKHIVERVNEIASLIYTPYVLFCADDDFIVPDAINSIVAFLEKNPDYSFGEGYILRFSRKNNDIMIAASYRHMLGEKITEDSPDKRILHLMNNFFSVCYSVYRTDILKEMYKSMLFNNKILIKQSYLIELYISVYPLIEGKLIVLPLLYQARETIWNSLGSTDSNIHAIVTKKRYRKDYNECVRLLAAHLSRKEGISFDNAKNIVEEAVMRFLNNVFPGYYTIKRRIIPEIKDRIKEFLKALLRIIGLYDHVKNIVDKYRLKHGIAINAAMPVDSLDTQDMEQWNKIRDYIIQSKASNR